MNLTHERKHHYQWRRRFIEALLDTEKILSLLDIQAGYFTLFDDRKDDP